MFGLLWLAPAKQDKIDIQHIPLLEWLVDWIPSLSGLPLGTDNGTISSVIQSTNQSRVPSSRQRADVRLKGKDTRSNAEHKVERKR